jgi:predicted ATPase
MKPEAGAPAVIEFGRFQVLPQRRELLADGVPVELGARAFDVLIALLQARGSVLGKDELISRVWPGRVVEKNNLQVQIAALRKALAGDRALVRTVAGRGYQFTGEIRGAAPPHASAAPPPPTNLPQPVAELIGRETELADVIDLVRAHRLVTLIGSGGIGKTLLAAEAARRLLPAFADGAWIADLGPLADPELVAVTVATALGLRLVAGAPSPEHVAAALGGKHVLLVLDNCEHVIEAAARVGETLLRATSGVFVLATSREPLRSEGENLYRVPPLGVPSEDNPDPEDILRYGAVRLFVARVHAAEPQYLPDPRLAPVKARICRRLDGIPLAIELAAARVDALGVEGVAARLDDRFRLLTGGHRTALPRHRTLRATLDWSHELLAEPERVVLRRLSVFAGRFGLEPAGAVAASAEITAADVVECVANLVAKSLVTADADGVGVHYRLLDTTRAYALEKLTASGELELFARRHAEYYLEVFQRAAAEWEVRPMAEWVAAYQRELDNVRAALDRSFAPAGTAEVGVALTIASVPLWVQVSLLDECRRRVERALSAFEPRPGPNAGRREMQLYAALGASLLYTRGPIPETGAAWNSALEIAERLDDTDYRMQALWGLWVYSMNTGEFRAALPLAERSYSLAEKRADPADLVVADRMLGVSLHYLGDQARARHHLERMLTRYAVPANRSRSMRFLVDQQVIGRAVLARIAWLQGFPDQAMRAALSNAEDARAAEHAISLCYALHEAACPVALLAGDLPAAERLTATLLEQTARHGLVIWHAWAGCFKAALLIKRGAVGTGLPLLSSGLGELRESGIASHYTELLGALADGLGGAGRIAEALVTIDEALERCERGEERWGDR